MRLIHGIFILPLKKTRPYLLKNSFIQTRLQKIMGTIFIGLEIYLLWEDLRSLFFKTELTLRGAALVIKKIERTHLHTL